MTQDKEFEEYIRRLQRMHRLTRNELVNKYWQHIQEVVQNGFIAFILRGSLCWESPQAERIESPSGCVWLKSDYYDPDGQPISAEPVKLYLQWYLNLYQIWGGIRTEVDPEDERVTKETLEQAIRDIHLLCDLISVTSGVSISWFPATYVEMRVKSRPLPAQEESPPHTEWQCLPFQRKQEEGITTGVNNDYFQNDVLPLFERIRGIENEALDALIRRSLAWYASGNFFGSGLNRFLNYWESIELVVHFFYNRLPPALVRRPSRSEKRKQVLALAQQANAQNCLSIAEQCARIVQPSARIMMELVLPLLTGRQDLVEGLFEKDPETGRSLYQIRNDIAHGNHCDHDLEFTDLVEQRLREMRSYSKAILNSTLQRVSILSSFIQQT